ncbi:hypothetical protein LCGC14_0954360 [marine sediment metagenome]|uniref:Uncharacterized protein n=1 Tax=marine sediment metagenome TaxID=412755 RepID=A0A0F9QZK6_9ZZZZ
MATNVWQGNAPAVKQVSTFTVSLTWATNDTAKLTCGSASVEFTVGGTQTIAAVVAGLVSLWNASSAPEIAEVDATDNSPDITLTMDTGNEGIPFTVTSSEVTGGDGVVGDQVDTTANSGPNCWDTAANWSLGAVPVATNDVVFENSSISCLYGLSQSGATLASLIQFQTFTGTIGLPRNNTADVSNPYVEYRPTYLAVEITTVYLGLGDGAGSGRIKLDTGAVQTDVNIDNSGTVMETGIPAILWKGTHVLNTMQVDKGSVGVCWFGGETANLSTLKVGYTDTVATDSDVSCGSGLAAGTTLDIDGGMVSIDATLVSVAQRDGILDMNKAAAITSEIVIAGGTTNWKSIGTFASVIVSDGGVLDCRKNNRARIASVAKIYDGGSIYDPAATVIWSQGIRIMEADFSGITLIMPKGRKWTPEGT